jgi:hypothetical protein
MGRAAIQKVWLSVGLMAAIGSPWIGTIGLLGAAGAIALTASAAEAADLGDWAFNPSTNQLEVSLPEGVEPRYFLVAEPARIVVDLPSTQVGAAPTEGNYDGAIQQIRIAQFEPDLARIVIQLSPETTLAPGQVQLEKIGEAEAGSQRWLLRPLVMAGAVAPIAEIQPIEVVDRPIAGSAVEARTEARNTVSAMPGLPPAIQPIETATPSVAVPETPTVAPRNVPVPGQGVPNQIENAPSRRDRQAARVARNAERQAARSARQPEAPQASVAQSLPPAILTPAATGTVNVPTLNPGVPAAPNRAVERAVPTTIAATDDVVPFGEPLPDGSDAPQNEPTVLPDRSNERERSNNLDEGRSNNLDDDRRNNSRDERSNNLDDDRDNNSRNDAPPSDIAVNSTFNTLIPAGTTLSLYYPQEEPLELTTEPQEEALFLAQNVRDRDGNLIAPINAQVIGVFESDRNGSRFIAQSIRIQGENREVTAASDSLGGRRDVSSNRVVRSGAAGAVAGLLLGLTTGIGVLAGAALGALSGAGSVFVSAPQAAVIEPNQIIEIRLLEDVSR